MNLPERTSARGRPRTITAARIAEAGIEIGLPELTFVGVAAALGVSHMALYKHVPSLEELKRLVAEAIFSRWQLPVPANADRAGLKAYLLEFSASMREFVKTNPGITPFVMRRRATTPAMLEKMAEHQRQVARAYGLSLAQTRWLLATVAAHGLAVSDTLYAVANGSLLASAEPQQEEAELEQELAQGMQALITGALLMLEQGTAAQPAQRAQSLKSS